MESVIYNSATYFPEVRLLVVVVMLLEGVSERGQGEMVARRTERTMASMAGIAPMGHGTAALKRLENRRKRRAVRRTRYAGRPEPRDGRTAVRECGVEEHARAAHAADRGGELDEITGVSVAGVETCAGPGREGGTYPSQVALTASGCEPAPQSGVCAGMSEARSCGTAGEFCPLLAIWGRDSSERRRMCFATVHYLENEVRHITARNSATTLGSVGEELTGTTAMG